MTNALTSLFSYNADEEKIESQLNTLKGMSKEGLERLVRAVSNEELSHNEEGLSVAEFMDLSAEYWAQSVHRAQNLISALRRVQNIDLGDNNVNLSYVVYSVCPKDKIVSQSTHELSVIEDRLEQLPEEFLSHDLAARCTGCGDRTIPNASFFVMTPNNRNPNPKRVESIVARQKGTRSTGKKIRTGLTSENLITDLDSMRIVFYSGGTSNANLRRLRKSFKEEFIPYHPEKPWKTYSESDPIKRFPGVKAWFSHAGLRIELQVMDADQRDIDRAERTDVFGNANGLRSKQGYLARKEAAYLTTDPDFFAFADLFTDWLDIGLIRHMQSSGQATLLAKVPFYVEKIRSLKDKYR